MIGQKSWHAKDALKFAFHRALAVTWGGAVALGLYLGVVTLGPPIEGKVAPVVTGYTLNEVRAEANGGVSFIPTFIKQRDCTYYGVSWFAPDEGGNLVRLQVAPLGEDATAPRTGPLGAREGRRTVIYPPIGSQSILAIMNHDCGLVWQTRTPLGPFPIPTPGALPDGAPSN